ncbi:Rhodanese-related sulfurtransferase [Prosthecobacter debontii]|uniref:Rhodanese-related sulfurtransferase n=1 Tax=Prosthecobacter debontii TaxID=48467 RepID=A0A1T4YXF5_9BACT|nr:rhodanese-like domain-containing protein [Prosthecobacter debontii]SKB06406.1 Rhodanese-related sulfurtransferase [Prosthecobacter debontii]
MKRSLFIAILCLCPFLLMAADKVKDVTPDEAEKLISKSEVTVLDVRTEEEFKEGHIKGAKNVDIMSKDFAQKLAQLDKTKPVLVHCQAGGRSTRSLPKLEQAGFNEIYHLKGGMSEWQEKGKPVEK